MANNHFSQSLVMTNRSAHASLHLVGLVLSYPLDLIKVEEGKRSVDNKGPQGIGQITALTLYNNHTECVMVNTIFFSLIITKI